jgi:cytoskeleton protein RodZ
MSEVEPAAEQFSPGRKLAAARAELNLSVADVSQQIKYGVKQIAAIEADDYPKLPGTTFVRGMIRSYAKLVRLDPQPLLAELGRRDPPAAVTADLRTSEREPFLEGGKESNRIYIFLSLAALAVVAVVAYERYVNPPSTGELVMITPKVAKSEAVQMPLAPASAPEQRGETIAPEQRGETIAQAVEQRSQATTVPVPAASRKTGGLKRIELEFDQISWVEVKQANGRILLSQLNPAGSRQSIEGVPPFEVVIGNAANVRLKYNDAPVDLRPYFKVDVARLMLE